MKFPDLIQEKEKLIATFSREFHAPLKDIRVIAFPYRISPLGAHIDHQGGPVLGMTINAYSLLACVPGNNGQVCLRSENYPGQLNFNLHQIPANKDNFWGSYALAAALALNEDWPLARGFSGLISGILPGCGLSSATNCKFRRRRNRFTVWRWRIRWLCRRFCYDEPCGRCCTANSGCLS